VRLYLQLFFPLQQSEAGEGSIFLIDYFPPQVEKTLAVSKECREKELKEHTADFQRR
jgi:hypothetical protein